MVTGAWSGIGTDKGEEGMSNLYQWAIQWGIPREAIADLRQRMGIDGLETIVDTGDENYAAKIMRLDAASQGSILWRNNVGAYQDDRGVFIRYGLANESKQMNKKVKSSDYIGIRPVLITQDMVGHTFGQFVARETKRPDWSYSGSPREVAQAKFMEIVIGYGGDACFSVGKF